MSETPRTDEFLRSPMMRDGLRGWKAELILHARKLEIALTTAERHLAAAKRDAEVGAAIQRAAGELPDGFLIELHVERGAGAVRLIHPDGECDDMDVDGDNRFAVEINAAIDAAIDALAGGEKG